MVKYLIFHKYKKEYIYDEFGNYSNLEVAKRFDSKEEAENLIIQLANVDLIIDTIDILSQETINHPLHYNKGKIEVIDFIEDQKLNFNLGNAVKYICRSEHKGDKKENLNKAIWYIQRELGINKK